MSEEGKYLFWDWRKGEELQQSAPNNRVTLRPAELPPKKQKTVILAHEPEQEFNIYSVWIKRKVGEMLQFCSWTEQLSPCCVSKVTVCWLADGNVLYMIPKHRKICELRLLIAATQSKPMSRFFQWQEHWCQQEHTQVKMSELRVWTETKTSSRDVLRGFWNVWYVHDLVQACPKSGPS